MIMINDDNDNVDGIIMIYKEPLVIVGDSKGCIHSLKLSPNLRQKTKVSQKTQKTKMSKAKKAESIESTKLLLKTKVSKSKK